MAFELFLFSTDLPLIDEAVAHGLSGVVVDWEGAGRIGDKQRR